MYDKNDNKIKKSRRFFQRKNKHAKDDSEIEPEKELPAKKVPNISYFKLDCCDDLFNFVSNNSLKRSDNRSTSSKLNKSQRPMRLHSFIKKASNGIESKVIKIEIYDASKFVTKNGINICNCDADICLQHIVKNDFLDEVHKLVEDAVVKFRYATRRNKTFIFLSLTCSTIAGASAPVNAILFAKLMQDMVNYGISVHVGAPAGDQLMKGVLQFSLYSCLMGLVLFTTIYLATVLISFAAYEQVYKIRQEYLKAALNQDFEYFDENQTGDFASKMTDDVVKLEEGMGEKLSTMVFYLSSFVCALTMAFIRGWKLALLCLISFPVTLFLVGLTGFIASRLSKKEAVWMGKAGSVAEEVLGSIRTVYAFSGQDKEINRYHSFLEKARDVSMKKGLYSALSTGALFFCIFCTYGMSFWFGYNLMMNEPETYDVQTFMSVFMGVLLGSANFGISTTLMEVFGLACGSGAQIFNLIDNVPKINPMKNEGKVLDKFNGEITFKDVVFHYPIRPDVQVLKKVSLTVKRGQAVALVGSSGCGKSTIIQLISRFYDVVEGEVAIDGNDVRQLSVKWLRQHIGVVSQEPVLFNTTIRENIKYGRESATIEDIEEAAKQSNAHSFIMKLPKGYDTLVGERGTSLSGGQKQRIAIARALVRNPPLLLLDEATSALDTVSEAKVQAALDKAQLGRTTIMVAHRLSTIRHADVIYVFDKGTIIESGNHEHLMQKKGKYYDMVTLQDFPEPEEYEGAIASRQSSVISVNEEEKEGEKIEVEEEAKQISFFDLLKLNKPEWKLVTVGSITSLLVGCGMPMLSVFIGDFAGILSNPDPDFVRKEIYKLILMFVGIGVIVGLASFIQVYTFAIGGQYLTERLRRTMFSKLLLQEVAYYDHKANSTGALCARLSGEAASVQGACGQRIGVVIQAVGTFIFALSVALYYEWRVGLLSLTLLPIFSFILFKQAQMITAESFGTAKTMEESSKIAVEAVSNYRTVASLGREHLFEEEYKKLLLPALLLAKRTEYMRGLVFGVARSISSIITAAALYYGGTLIVYHGVEYSNVLISAQVLLMGTSTSTQMFAFSSNFQKGKQAARRILMLFERESKITDPVKSTVDDFKATGEASLEDIRFRYPTRTSIEVLKGINLEVEKGKTVALVGTSGCGKSTIIQLLERYYDPDSGIVALDKVPLRTIKLAKARQTIGLVRQEPILFDRTIGENIAYGDNSRECTMDEIIDVAKKANIHNFVTSLPKGYETNIGSKGTQLSGGQKQRIAIARALIRNPKMLLLDEATSALDTESEKVVQDALDKAKKGRTCITIAHRLSTIRDADVICVLNQGRIAEKGTHQELLEAKGLYYELHRQGH